MTDLVVAPWQLDSARLSELLPKARTEYVNASPWPHVVLHGLFPEELLEQAALECRGASSDRLFRTRDRNQLKEESSSELGPVSRLILAQIDSPAFRDFVSALTAVNHLLADPGHQWAGLHRTPPGGFTMIHRDFREHPLTGLHHRVNVLLYLNRQWPDSYGGGLELWPSNMRAPGRLIRPLANTLVIFETHDQTLHGVPEPVACPPGQARLSLASYFFTVEARTPAVPIRRPVFARRPEDSFLVGRRSFVSVIGDCVPAALTPFARTMLWKARGLRGRTRGLSEVPEQPTPDSRR